MFLSKWPVTIFLGLVLSVSSFTAAADAGTVPGHGTSALPNAPTASTTPDLHSGSVCKNVQSAGGWNGTICAVVNLSDASLDRDAQALITYSVRSNGLKTIYADGDLYLRSCSQTPPFNCVNQNVLSYPSKSPGGVQSSFISNAFVYEPGAAVQAIVVFPCIDWSNGQNACYNGTLKSTIVVVPFF